MLCFNRTLPRLTAVVLSAFTALSAAAHGDHTHWGYTGHDSPESWGNLSEEFRLCSTGKNQSPVNITETVSGTILSLYEAGMEIRRVPNSFRFVDSSGAIRDESMYMNNKSDRRLFAVGKEIMIFYVYDELKKSTQRPGAPLDLENNYVGQVIEMAISK